MKIHRQRYQTGSVRKVPRAHGFAWEFRYYYTDTEGKRKLKVQTFDATIYRTERDVRKSVEAQLASLNANTLAGRPGWCDVWPNHRSVSKRGIAPAKALHPDDE